jgi:CheY-like chemotaxis protein
VTVKILLVEDEKSVLEATRAMLQALNYRVLSATNGQEALQIYQNRQQEIALILSDMMMPDMDGVALFQALRARNPHIKIVMMTGYPLYQKSQEILSQDAVPWINKPMTFRRLAQVIAQTI